MQKHNIEFRRGNAGGGNQLRQPYLKKYVSHLKLRNFKNVEHVHHFGYYIGNYPDLKYKKIKNICSILNKLKKFK
jgi:CDP-6-deoxy-D-xylo-4-hexulose-3-dehydrase